MKVPPLPHCGFIRKTVLAVTMMALGPTLTLASAEEPKLAPQTKVRVTIVQWVPAKSEYVQWSALSGEFVVSDGGAISLPVIGTVPVGDLSGAELAAEIATRLKTTIGLTETPAATVEVLEYPPIYVVGDVSKPGEYKFHTGLTVLQALAMSGGELRSSTQIDHARFVDLVGELKGIENSILRSGARIARLQAELSGEKDIHFEQPNGPDGGLATAIYSQERIIFNARANALDRQSKSLSELRDLINAEIDNIAEKTKGIDSSIKSTEDQLEVAKSLVERGAATNSRQIDLERMLTGYRSDRLDMITASMRAHQSIAETARNLAGLYDARHTEVASDLQSEQASLEQLKSKRDTLQKQLLDALQSGDGSLVDSKDAIALSFSIIRRVTGKIENLMASEATGLVPGDVVKVARSLPAPERSPVQSSAPGPAALSVQAEK
ncbi:polysaccharide biosynthesis/export family protein [Rhizobium sp. RAF56]|uniref:polysaccharide biosynthesis/export family protein n=1 Tax=Rhizobium sp. RAF56 TaxID=3233062 RepID=UPI003F9EABCE